MANIPARANGAAVTRLPRGLADLVDPIPAATFERDYWGKRQLVVHRNDPEHYRDLLTLADVDGMLSSTSLHAPELMVVSAGQSMPAGGPRKPGGADSRRGMEPLYEQYRKGATILLMFLNERWPPLGRLAAALAEEITARVSVNAYLTPAGAQGFDAHFDTHDVFVAQVHGTKHWRLYGTPVRLPLRGQQYLPPAGGPGEPEQEFDLRAGDLLYLPRGAVHEATSGEEASLHLTIGVAPMLWVNALHEAIDRAAGQHAELRESLPFGFGMDPARQQAARAHLTDLAACLFSEVAAHAIIAEAGRRATQQCLPVLTGHLTDLEALRSAGLGTAVRHRDGVRATLTTDGRIASLEFCRKVVTFPARVTPELEFVIGTRVFTARDIPGPLDEAGRMLLVTTLVGEGLLTFA
jgi:ribosomal protein L16 Arg81 hydroxylase